MPHPWSLQISHHQSSIVSWKKKKKMDKQWYYAGTLSLDDLYHGQSHDSIERIKQYWVGNIESSTPKDEGLWVWNVLYWLILFYRKKSSVPNLAPDWEDVWPRGKSLTLRPTNLDLNLNPNFSIIHRYLSYLFFPLFKTQFQPPIRSFQKTETPFFSNAFRLPYVSPPT